MRLSAKAVEQLEWWWDHPDDFDRDVWPHHLPEDWQSEASSLIAAHDKVAIRSGHGVGKTAWLARRILWWLSTRHPAKVGCTAPSSNTMFDALWSEIAIWLNLMPKPMQEVLEWKAERLERRASPNVSFAVAKTARRETPEALAGLHSPNMLFVIDEAPGVDDIIFQTAEGAMSTIGAKTIMTGNPTRLSGYFYDAFHSSRQYWKTMKVSCFDSKLTNRKWVEEKIKEWGEDSNFVRVRVLGEFPKGEEDVVIPLYIVEAARDRDVAEVEGEDIWGLDVSRGGSDYCALAKRSGNVKKEPVRVWQSDDAMHSAGIVVKEYREAQKKPISINVDAIGLGGPVADALTQAGLPAVCVNVSESHSVSDKYLRLRDELWHNARDWFFSRQVKIDNDEAFIGEISLIKWGLTPNGKMKVETKAEMKKRFTVSSGDMADTKRSKSPDRSEAWIMTFYGTGVISRKPAKIIYPKFRLA